MTADDLEAMERECRGRGHAPACLLREAGTRGMPAQCSCSQAEREAARDAALRKRLALAEKVVEVVRGMGSRHGHGCVACPLVDAALCALDERGEAVKVYRHTHECALVLDLNAKCSCGARP